MAVGQVSHKSTSSLRSFKCGSIAEEAVQPLATTVKPGKAGRGKSWSCFLRFHLCRQTCAGDQVVLHHVLEERLQGGEYDGFAEYAGVQLVRGVSVSEEGEGARQCCVADGAGQQVGGRQCGGGEAGHGGG